MSIFNKSSLSKVLMMAVLGVAITACSSPEKDAEVREEPAMPVDAQQNVIQDAAQTDSTAATGITLDAEQPMADTTADAAHSTTMPDMATADASIATQTDTMAMTDEATAVGNDQIGTHNNADIADGTDIEENVSTY